jgi:hypothetical protein
MMRAFDHSSKARALFQSDMVCLLINYNLIMNHCSSVIFWMYLYCKCAFEFVVVFPNVLWRSLVCICCWHHR